MPVDSAPANSLFAPASPIMRPRSFHRGENCTDIAIPLIATGGCRAVSAGVLARRFGVTAPAVLKWFGSTSRMWGEIAEAVGRRWYAQLDRASRLDTEFTAAPLFVDLDLHQAVSLFLPLDAEEVEWTRVWLSILELGRHHELVGSRVAQWEAQELEALYRATGCRDVPTLTATMVVVRGLRQLVAATHQPLPLAEAHAMLRRHVTHAYVDRGIPEPAGEDDVLSSTRRFTHIPARHPGN